MKQPASAGSTSKSYTGAGRSVQITTAEVAGRPVVLYADMPAGASTNILDLNKIELRQ